MCATRWIGAWSSASSIAFDGVDAVKRSMLIRWIGALLIGLVSASSAIAAASSSTFAAKCSGCHSGPPPAMLSQTPTAGSQYGLLLNNDGIYAATTAGLKASIPGTSGMSAYIAGYIDPLTAGEWTLISAYLVDVRDGVVTTPNGAIPKSNSPSTTLTFSSQVLVGATYPDPVNDQSNPALKTITIENPRGLSIKYKVSTPAAFPTGYPNCAGTDINGYHTVAAGATCTVLVGFNPSSSGSQSGAMTIDFQSSSATDTAPGTRTLTLQGTGFRLGPNQIGPAALTTNIGTPTSTSVSLTNSGATAITLNSIAFSGSPNGFSLPAGANMCGAGVVIGSGSSCTLYVGFDGAASGSANIVVKTTTPTSSDRTIQLFGVASPFPQIAIDTASPLDLGERVINTGPSAATTIKVSNTGTAPLAISSVSQSGNVGDFVVAGDCLQGGGITIPVQNPNATCSIVAQFSPAVVGSRSMTLTILSNADGHPSVPFTLTGTGKPVPAAKLSVSPTTLPIDFGHQTIDNPLYPSRTLHIENIGDLAMTLGVTLPASGFAITNPCPATLAVSGQPGSSCDMTIRFAPTQVGPYNAAITLATNDAANLTKQITLAGTGDSQAVPVAVWSSVSGSVSPVTALNFPTVPVGSQSAPQTVYLRNQGPGGMQISVVNVIGSGAGAFVVTGCNAAQVVYAGDECAVQVVFSPEGAGAKTASLQAITNGSVPAPLEITGSGSGGPQPTIAVDVAAVAMGSVRLGARSAPQDVTISNPGSAPLHVASLTVTGPFVVEPKTCGAAPFAVTPNASCTISIKFVPTTQGQATGKLQILSDANPMEVSLSGQAEEAADVSSGGCSVSPRGEVFDPTLWTLVLLAAGVLWHRHRTRPRRRAKVPSHRASDRKNVPSP